MYNAASSLLVYPMILYPIYTTGKRPSKLGSKQIFFRYKIHLKKNHLLQKPAHLFLDILRGL